MINFKNEQYTIGAFIIKCLLFFPRRIRKFYRDIQSNLAEKKEIKDIITMMKDITKHNFEPHLQKKLCKRLKNAYLNVPYYSQFKCLKTVTPNNVFEILSKLPLLSKTIIMEQKENMYSKKYDVKNCPEGHTGGTTGTPLKFHYSSPSGENSHQKALYKFMTGLNYKGNLDKQGKIVSLCGARPTENNTKNNIFWTHNSPSIYGSIDFCTLFMNDTNNLFYLEEMNRIQPLIMRGYSNAILNFAHFIDIHNLQTKITFHLKGIYVTSEYCSLESMKYISKIFNCNVYGQYGQAEACLFAWTKPNDNVYYCSPLYGHVEILDEQGKPVKKGECGEVVVTGFGNDVLPFIRYKTGDIVKYGGRINGIAILSNLVGKNNSYIITLKKEKIFLSGFLDIHYLTCGEKIKSYQIQQDIVGEIIFRIIHDDSWIQEDENEISELLKVKNISIFFEYPNIIPLTKNGKQVMIIQNLK